MNLTIKIIFIFKTILSIKNNWIKKKELKKIKRFEIKF